MTKYCKDIITIVATLVLIPLLMIEQGWAISTLWDWFIVPLGAPAIGIATAIGASIIVGVARMKHDYEDDRPDRKFERLVYSFLTPLVAVSIGWIVKQFA